MTERRQGGSPGEQPPDAAPRCPWCSAAVTEDADRCPSCGAVLRDSSAAADDQIPGVTQVDPVIGLRRAVARPNRLIGWLADVDTEPAGTFDVGRSGPTGLDGVEGLAAPGQESVAPPSDEVLREIRRLEIDALKAELEARQAEAAAAGVDAAATEPEPTKAGERPATDGSGPADGPQPGDAPSAGTTSPASNASPEGRTGG